jgi:molecular chaperone DnaJ
MENWNMSDYYKKLGVSKNASQEEIKKAYKNLAKQYHPDLNKDNPESEQKFKEINEAFSVLGNEKKRSQYDQFGTTGNFSDGHQGFGGFEGFDFGGDPFADIFDTFFGERNRRRRPAAERGSDLLYELEITLEEAYQGTKKTITLTTDDICSDCNGSGAKDSSDITTCPQCNGSGTQVRQQRTPFGIFQSTVTCSNCGGTGKVIKNFCEKCHGKGTFKSKKNIEVSIPAGIDTGNRLRIPGKGEAGSKGGGHGDLYVEIRIKKHKIFEREQENIYTRVPISFKQAVLGDTIDVPTLDGRAKLKIPPGTQSGTQFKMKDKGMTVLQGHGHGDEFVKIYIETPAKITRKQKELLEEFDASLGESPYESFVKRVKEWLS